MKLIYNTDKELIEEGVTYYHNINPFNDIRIESDSYQLLESESLLTNLERLVVFSMVTKRISNNELRQYLILNVVPNWDSLSDLDKATLQAYECNPGAEAGVITYEERMERDKVFSKKLLDEFLLDSRIDPNITTAISLQLLQKFGAVGQLLQFYDVKGAYVFIPQIDVDAFFTQERKDKYMRMIEEHILYL